MRGNLQSVPADVQSLDTQVLRPARRQCQVDKLTSIIAAHGRPYQSPELT